MGEVGYDRRTLTKEKREQQQPVKCPQCGGVKEMGRAFCNSCIESNRYWEDTRPGHR